MTKRKRETADEESATLEQPKNGKKQRSDTTRAPQGKATSNVGSQHGTEISAQVPPDRRTEKLARRLAKREAGALVKPRQGESGRKDGMKTREDDIDTESVNIRGGKSLEKGQITASRNRHGSREREQEGGQKLTAKHKSKIEKRRERTAGSRRRNNKEKAAETATWKVSDPLGGQMLDADPVFSPDEK